MVFLNEERKKFLEGKKRGAFKKSKNWPIPISHTSKTTQRKNIAQSNKNNTNNKNNNIKEEEGEQHFFDEDCHVVPEYVPVELIDANDVEQVSELYSSELYSSVNTGVEFFPSAAATTANVYVPTAKSQKRSSFEDFLGEFIGYEETIDDAIVPTF